MKCFDGRLELIPHNRYVGGKVQRARCVRGVYAVRELGKCSTHQNALEGIQACSMSEVGTY